MGSIPLIQGPADLRNIFTILLFLSAITLVYSSLWRWPTQSGKGWTTDRSLLWGLLLLVTPYLPASNMFIRVGFVVAERILYIPR